MSIDPKAVALAHDAMAEEYDQLDDYWYPWLFARIHELIAAHLPSGGPTERDALDVGCGTGFQSFLLARAGYRVLAIDIAAALVEAARSKSPMHAVPPSNAPDLFSSRSFPSTEHHARLAGTLERARGGRPVHAPDFVVADALAYPIEEDRYDVIVCCGSVLSFIDAYDVLLARMAKALRPGGLLFLEVEQRANLDLVWPAVDRLVGGRLGYEQSWPEIIGNLFAPPGRSLRVDYPFDLQDGREVVLPIWLFSVVELVHLFGRGGLTVRDRIGVHVLSNLIPSTILHRIDPPKFVSGAAQLLFRAEARVADRWPFWRLGCSVVYCLERI